MSEEQISGDKMYRKISSFQISNGNFITEDNYLDPDMYSLEVIAEGLAGENRYCSQNGDRSINVAIHTLLAEAIADEIMDCDLETRMRVLHHDDTEAIFKDLPSFWKRMLPKYQHIEQELNDRVILPLIGLSEPSPGVKAQIKRADWLALCFEQLMINEGAWTLGVDRKTDLKIKYLTREYQETWGISEKDLDCILWEFDYNMEYKGEIGRLLSDIYSYLPDKPMLTAKNYCRGAWLERHKKLQYLMETSEAFK